MPFIPHTEQDIKEMLKAIGVDSIETLFDEIPGKLKISKLKEVPPGASELAVSQLMQQRADQNKAPLSFIGAGAYEHHIPAAVWDIVGRGEFMTSYTPYQAEASQGNLQLLYEYQTMLASLTGMEVSNASLYDGASALAEAILMAVRANKNSNSRHVLVPRTVHPAYRKVARAIVQQQNIELTELPYNASTGQIDMAALEKFKGQDITALVIPQPNFFGVLEDIDTLTDFAKANKLFSIAVVNPLSLALLKPPQADIVCGEGQPLGVPVASGGPYFGFMCAKQAWVRQMPGRIVGRTVDKDGKTGFTLTLQAREQHIRRSKATSNICTNQGLLVTAATIYMSVMGPEGLKQTAIASHANCKALVTELTTLPNVKAVFNQPYFHEAVLKFQKPVLKQLEQHNILGGYDLREEYPELENCVLVCATETKQKADLNKYKEALKTIIA